MSAAGSERADTRAPRSAVIAVAVVSFAVLAAELALTRVFSVLFRAPYVFLIVSGAIGGLGLGGLIAQGVRPREGSLTGWIAWLSAALGAALAAPTLVLFASPWGRDLVARGETWVVIGLPTLTFAAGGMLLALLFRRYAADGGRLYFIDLSAAAAAAPLSVLMLDHLGGLNTPLALGAATATVGAVLATGRRLLPTRIASGLTAALLAGCLATNLSGNWISLPPLRMPSEARSDPGHPWHLQTKPLFVELADPYTGSRIVRTDWSAVSRTDVVLDPNQNLFYVYTDGDVPTQMAPWDGTFESVRKDYAGFIGMLPYRVAGKAPSSVLAIGSGGGLDVLLALTGGARHVDAVEINPSIPRIVKDPRFSSTYARVYQRPEVRLLVDEGRSFLQRSGSYDLIYFACAKTATTQTSGVALLDNHLYTVEAFRDYWRRLNPDGMVALITQEGFLIDRLMVTALKALRDLGIPNADQHLATARIPEQLFGTGPYRHALLLKRSPWSRPAAEDLVRGILANRLEPLYIPHLNPQGAGGQRFDPAAGLATIRSLLEKQYPIPIDPMKPDGATTLASLEEVTDDRPFYVDVAHGLHPFVRGLLEMSAIGAAAVAVLALGICARTGLSGNRRASIPRASGAVLYFGCLGAGFIMVELALMHRFVLLLGFPTRALTVTLFSLLLACAAGSRFSQRGEPLEAWGRLRKLLPLLLALCAIYYVALARLLELLLGSPLPVRIAATALLIAPPAFLMGMPFPTALRLSEGRYASLVPAFWSVNGAFTILGSVGAMALAKFYGYSGALVAGAVLYLLAWLVLPVLKPEPMIDETSITLQSSECRDQLLPG